MTKIKTLIIDDEPLYRKEIIFSLNADPDIDIIAECEDGQSALETIEAEQPDLIFLDIKLPIMDGFEVLENLDPRKLPVIIFTTAFEQYAIKAFQCQAIDYLLKPIDKQRLETAVKRAKNKILSEQQLRSNDEVIRLLNEIRSKNHLTRLVIKKNVKYIFINVTEIIFIEANHNYVNIHTKNDIYLHRISLKAMASRLDPEKFIKINRFAIVNLDWIKEVQELFKGDLVIILKNGKKLPLGRRNRDKIKSLVSQL